MSIPIKDLPGFSYGTGMELRDYFAAAALTGLLANDCPPGAPAYAASAAYKMADAMLKAREARP